MGRLSLALRGPPEVRHGGRVVSFRMHRGSTRSPACAGCSPTSETDGVFADPRLAT
jgi:hypothetical protein